MGCDWSICQNLNNLNVFWMNKVRMKQRKVTRWRKVAGAISSLVNARVLHWSCLFLCMVMIQ